MTPVVEWKVRLAGHECHEVLKFSEVHGERHLDDLSNPICRLESVNVTYGMPAERVVQYDDVVNLGQFVAHQRLLEELVVELKGHEYWGKGGQIFVILECRKPRLVWQLCLSW